MAMLYSRPYLEPDGGTRRIHLVECECGPARRGPPGGCCSLCGNAIPDEKPASAPPLGGNGG